MNNLAASKHRLTPIGSVSSDSPGFRICTGIVATMLLLQVVAVYLGSFRVDDWTNLERGRWAISPAGRLAVWTQINPYLLYRPLVDYWHGAMLQIFGLQPRPMLAALVLLLLATSVLLARLVRERGGDRFTALLAVAAIWAQPNTYAWTTQWVSNVTASLVAFTSLAVLVQHHRAVRHAARGESTFLTRGTMVLIFLAGALCKEEIVLLPGALMALEWARWPRLTERSRRSAVTGIVLLGSVAALYAIVRTHLFPPPPAGRYHLTIGMHTLSQLRFFAIHLGAMPLIAGALTLTLVPASRRRDTWTGDTANSALREVLGGLAWAAIAISLFLMIRGRPAYGYLYVPAFAMSYAVARLLGYLRTRQTQREGRIAGVLAIHAIVATTLTIWGLLDVRWPEYGPLTREVYQALDLAVPNPQAGTLFAFVDPGEHETRAGRTIFSMIFDGFVGPLVRLHYGRTDIDAVLVANVEAIPPTSAVAFVARNGHLTRVDVPKPAEQPAATFSE